MIIAASSVSYRNKLNTNILEQIAWVKRDGFSACGLHTWSNTYWSTPENLPSLSILRNYPLEGKPYAVIACGGVQSPRQAIESVQRRMSAYKAVLIGDVAFKSCILPCFKCGYGTVCEIGASQYVYGEEGRKQLKITKGLFKRWEDTPEVKNQADAITAKVKMP